MKFADLSPEFIDSLTDDQRAELLKNMVQEAQVEEEQERVSETVQKRDQSEFIAPSRKIKAKNEAVAWQGNQWTDDGAESKGEEFDTPEIKLAARVRNAPTYKTVRCNLCHDEFEKRADHIYGKYNVCNDCGGRR